MKFTEHKMKDLPGKLVAWTYSNFKGEDKKKVIVSIEKTVKKGFVIEGQPDKIFSFFTGKEINSNTKNALAISYCELVNPTKVENLQRQWRKIKHKDELLNIIKDNQNKLHVLPISILKNVVDQLAIYYDNIKVPAPVEELQIHNKHSVNIKAEIENIKQLMSRIQADHNLIWGDINKQIKQLQIKIENE